MFKKMLASVGIGNAKVDTVLSNTNVQIGGLVTGSVNVTGGNVEQKVENIYLEVTTMYNDVNDDDEGPSTTMNSAVVQKITIPINSVLGVKQTAQVPFQFILSSQTPVTHGKTKVWIRTGLDIKGAIDPKDRDYLTVHPHPYMNVVMEAMGAMGFQLKSAENEVSNKGIGVPFVQEFEYKPTQAFNKQIHELDIVFYVYHNEGLGMTVEVDRKARGLKGILQHAVGKGESNVNVRFTHDELAQGVSLVGNRMYQIIESYAK